MDCKKYIILFKHHSTDWIFIFSFIFSLVLSLKHLVEKTKKHVNMSL